ncbi:MAG: YegP family protein [Clostridia bacterium]|nr:YegP family protein [Clostridia bacterium]
MKTYFEVKIAKNGEYMFNFFAKNGKIIATSETYTTKQNCLLGIESVKANADAPIVDIEGTEEIPCPKFEVFEDVGGRFRFHLRAKNGEIVCASQGYSTKQSCLLGIESVKTNAAEAEIEIME